MSDETETVLERVVQSIQNSGAINAILWLGSGLGGLFVMGWVLFGGPLSEVEVRAQAVERLWPIVTIWGASLVGKSKVTGDQKRELVKAHTAVRLAETTNLLVTNRTDPGSGLG